MISGPPVASNNLDGADLIGIGYEKQESLRQQEAGEPRLTHR